MDAHPPETNASSRQAPMSPPQPAPRRGGPLSGPAGLAFALALLAVAGFLTYRVFYEAEPDGWQGERMFVCSETGKSFKHTLSVSEGVPVLSPFSGKKTGYLAEPCYWTKDGKLMNEPVTWVILNATLKKEGDTICPDCGRIVQAHNAERAERERRAQATSGPASSPAHP